MPGPESRSTGPTVAPRPGVPPRSLADAAVLLGVEPPAGWRQRTLSGITLDSRSVRPGDLYAALPGERAHGAHFSAAAARAGAAAILTDPPGAAAAESTGLPVLVVDAPRQRLGELSAWVYGQPAQDLLVVGITGTNGKTTTAYLVEAGLRAAGHRTGLVGTVETRIGDEALPSVRTTPEAPDLQALFALMRAAGTTAVAMEVSSHALAQGRVDGTAFTVAVFTNLSEDHLDFHGDLERYFAAKAALFRPGRCRRAVVNLDDEYGRRIAGHAEVPVTTFSAAGLPAADWRAEDIATGPAGSRFLLAGPGGVRVAASVRLLGGFNVANALAALAALVTAGVDPATAVDGVAACPGVPGRMEPVDAGQPYAAVVDYAHTPTAVEWALATLREVTKGRLLAVLGCGGDRDAGKRPRMGAVASAGADLVVLTNDNPRSEDPLDILAAVRQGAEQVPESARAEVVVVPDRAAAIALAVGRAEPGDTVAVLGKGHEQGQQVGDVVTAFDDRDVLRTAITQRGTDR